MKRYSYRDSMGHTTSVENWLMNCGINELPKATEAGAIFRSLCDNHELVTLTGIETMLSDPDARHLQFELVAYTVADVRKEIKKYRYARTRGGKYADTTYFQP